jgi:tetratricopeptide (TPR) repeat protein
MKKLSVNVSAVLLAVFIILTGLFHYLMPKSDPYPPVFSKTYPLSTPISFWASMMGMRRLATDIVWIQTVQYYGERQGTHLELGSTEAFKKADKKFYPELRNYWLQIIRLDPLLANAYLLGPTTLGWNLKRYDEALEILTEGIKALETIEERSADLNLRETDRYHPLILGGGSYFKELKWKLYLLKSTLIYMNREEFDRAIPQLEKIAFAEGTPIDIKVILAQLYEQETQEYSKALQLWIDIYENAQRENRRESALKNISRLRELISSN